MERPAQIKMARTTLLGAAMDLINVERFIKGAGGGPEVIEAVRAARALLKLCGHAVGDTLAPDEAPRPK